ncbi:hypothetical protein L486_07071 [Kwoniella mangroviensis CBS 10435]|uniref:Uncharacterized protein n=1 Tax=Kwoniella mangroviensis CBS 10435 TaxID=1331196 RepID=A0A1B9IJD6_9TREE|nr:uncharacterized protein I203_07679 [Kwoniella mangroviensis CBS 8507]OCF55587.1 hypothetical protein L486_07071 [Kwoniella mangroviensis CBS 10435]OCF63254.1 hypothetical protein I203_07679 [Kwoniella mangroviensis CBS 8507]OCF73681.1 hypothetical protein I204_05525 [Kwoniella mangroviensis CBS 8886]
MSENTTSITSDHSNPSGRSANTRSKTGPHSNSSASGGTKTENGPTPTSSESRSKYHRIQPEGDVRRFATNTQDLPDPE